MLQGAKNSLITFDLNATRAQALRGTVGEAPHVLALDESQNELPMALSLENRQIEVGQAGVKLCRRLPHLVCQNFLAHLGTAREWAGGRHRVDAAKAMSLIFARMQVASGNAGSVLFTVPGYLNDEQRQTLCKLAEKAKWRVLGSIASPLAAALSAHAEQAWSGLALVVDGDDQALTFSGVLGVNGQARLLATQSVPRLGVLAWKERLLDAIAERCVRQSRRDPRDSADAEQALFEQLDQALETCQRGQMAEVVVQTSNWCQNLLLRPEDLAAFCAPLAIRAVEELVGLNSALAEHGPPALIVATANMARLPGLLISIEDAFPATAPLAVALPPVSDEDFGESLMADANVDFGDQLLDADSLAPLPMASASPSSSPSAAWVLAADGPIRAAHEIACLIHRGELPRGSVLLAPLPSPVPLDSGPVRLKFNRQDYLLGHQPFTLGRHPSCDLVFDSVRHPTVSAWHCEIVQDRQNYLVRDQSRNGTLVNDRPIGGELILHSGDWIRLGPGGPLLHFVGKPLDQRKHWSIVSG